MGFTIIKSYDCSTFSIALIQDDEGRYAVVHSTGDADEYSSWTDYRTAEYMFDLRIQELAGN